MDFKAFNSALLLRLCFMLSAMLGFSLALVWPGYHAVTLLLLVVSVIFVVDLMRYISRTNREIARFFGAVKYQDLNQGFKFDSLGADFDKLGDVFTDILKSLQLARANKEQELRHLKAMVEHVPVPLIAIHADERLTLWNNAARRLLCSAGRLSNIAKLEDLREFGVDLMTQVRAIVPGERRLVTFMAENIERQMTLVATQVTLQGNAERLISMQDIQSELDGVQLQAWQDLVAVLSHEIMNSITPVASLAKTSADLVDDVRIVVAGQSNPGRSNSDQSNVLDMLDDVKDAVTTVAKRSDSLMHFVASYRKLTRLPEPEKSRQRIATLISPVQALMSKEWAEKNISLKVDIEPSELDLNVDAGLLEQALINLLTNAAQACVEQEQATVWLIARLNRRGRVTIDVSDNGPGVPSDVANNIFVPFFTTKTQGSGVGLALARQVMVAHGGSISFSEREGGGATFSLLF
jgi:nitrogen fixation/metabolism regulation signal transduction histidine kinase